MNIGFHKNEHGILYKIKLDRLDKTLLFVF